jgi:hypothetical protein
VREKIKVLENKADMLAQTANQPFLLADGFPGINGDIPTRMVPPSGCSSRLILRSSVVFPSRSAQ